MFLGGGLLSCQLTRKASLVGDLHMHSNRSDGSLDLEKMFFIAAKSELDFLSITDHNFLSSSSELFELGKKYGIKPINGVELSCYDTERKRKVHILCYCFVDYEVLMPVCERAIKIRKEIGKIKAEYVAKHFIVPPSLIEKYKSKSGVIYQQNLVHALIDCGYCNSVYGELYDSLSSKNLKIETESDLDVKFVVNLIHKAGGKAVMAHPFVYDSIDLLNELIEEKLIDGIEVWHPKNSKQQQQILLSLVKKNDLIATGGTDFHGFYSSCYLVRIGDFCTPEAHLNKLLQTN